MNNRLWLQISVIAACSLFLSACASDFAIVEKKDGTVSPTSANQSSPNPLTSQSPAIVALPLNLTCNELMNPANLYDFNPNFSFDPSAKFLETTLSKQINDLDKVNCVYLNLSSQQTIQLSVIKVSQESVQALAEKVENIPGVTKEKSPEGVSSLFINDLGVGTTIQLVDNYCISVTSTGFQQASDAQNFITPIVNSLR